MKPSLIEGELWNPKRGFSFKGCSIEEITHEIALQDQERKRPGALALFLRDVVNLLQESLRPPKPWRPVYN